MSGLTKKLKLLDEKYIIKKLRKGILTFCMKKIIIYRYFLSQNKILIYNNFKTTYIFVVNYTY
jgi:hypothetical protein